MKVLISLFASVLLATGVAYAGEPATPPADAPPSVATAAAEKAPAKSASDRSSFRFGFEERIRTENFNNLGDFNDLNDDERRQIRYRTRIWGSYNGDLFDFAVGLNNEFSKKYALKPADVGPSRLNLDEAIFETLYLDLKKLPIKGLDLRIGRQELMRGEGFILFDGTSGDGSRTAYFNAVNLSYQHNKSKFELIGLINPKQDRFLGIIHDSSKYLNEWDEQAVGMYYTNRDHKNTDVDAYYFYKKEVHDYRAPTNPQFQPDRAVNTLGARVVRRLPQGFSMTAEFAGQWGDQHANPAVALPAADVRAYGGYGYVKKTFDSKWKPYVQTGFWVMSGGDPNDPTTAGNFDPLFSRWPKYSELYIYSLAPENGVAYWTNNKMFQMEAGINPTQKLKLRGTFYTENAFHPYTKRPTMFGSGTHRGENYQVRADYVFNKSWKTHMLYENMAPGDFYLRDGGGFFFRAEVSYTFNKMLHLGSK